MSLPTITTPLLRDDHELYGKLMEDMLLSYVVSDNFCSLSRQDREERIGAYDEIKLLIDSAIANSNTEQRE